MTICTHYNSKLPHFNFEYQKYSTGYYKITLILFRYRIEITWSKL